ncbi:MAG: hypothetical protein IJ906_07825 [Oscillospiraceae bacterium]|nr:hypothetical protein [Oscillospiraceae bacterium]
MKQALIEQGFIPQGSRNNQLVSWEESERDHMEKRSSFHGEYMMDYSWTEHSEAVCELKEICASIHS